VRRVAFAPVWPSLPDVAHLVGAGHFVWKERPGGYASLIMDWVTDGYLAAADGP
jgi:hypothetical protein